MAHAQKSDSVFQGKGRVHLYRRGCQFSRVLAFLECGSGENDCSNSGWTVPSQTEDCLVTHSIRLFPLHFSPRASPCAIRFRFHSTSWRLLAGCIKSPELASSLALRLPASCWEALAPLPDVALRLLADTAGFFFLRDMANLNSLRRAGSSCKVEIAFIKANSSCLSMLRRQEHSKGLPLTPPL